MEGFKSSLKSLKREQMLSLQNSSLTSCILNLKVDVLLNQSESLHRQPSKNRQLLYQATHPQDVTVTGWEAQAPGYSSYASSLYELANHNYNLPSILEPLCLQLSWV